MKNRIIGIVVTIIGLALLFGAYIIGEHNGEQNAQKNNNNNDNKEEKEDIKKQDDPKIVDKGFDTVYLTYIPSIMRYKLSDSFFVYQNKKITINDLSDEVIYSAAMNSLPYTDITVCQEKDKKAHNNCDILVAPSLLKTKVKEMYGKELSGKTPKKLIGNGGITCNLVKDYYECMNGEEASNYSDYSDYFFYGNEYMNSVVFDKYESKDGYVYAYVRFINVRLEDNSNYDVNDLNTYRMKLYESTNDDKLIDESTILGRDYYNKDDITTFGTKLITKYSDKAPLYKHAYKIDKNGNYIWEYTEKVSE